MPIIVVRSVKRPLIGDDPDAGEETDESAYIGRVYPDEVVREEQLRPTSQQHEQLKNALHGADLDLWAPAFDVLSAMGSHIVGVLEDFNGGHVWELGYLYHHRTRVRDALWLLKRLYRSENEMREKYDNGMAASHLPALEKAAEDRVITWGNEDDVPDAIHEIP